MTQNENGAWSHDLAEPEEFIEFLFYLNHLSLPKVSMQIILTQCSQCPKHLDYLRVIKNANFRLRTTSYDEKNSLLKDQGPHCLPCRVIPTGVESSTIELQHL